MRTTPTSFKQPFIVRKTFDWRYHPTEALSLKTFITHLKTTDYRKEMTPENFHRGNQTWGYVLIILYP